MKYQLYKLSKTDKILSFEIETDLCTFRTDSNKYPCIVTRKGFIDGTKQEDLKYFTEGKNLGRANETTPWEQASAEAESQYKKLLDKGYKKWDGGPIGTFEMAQLYNWLKKQGVGTDASGKLKPMLAHKTLDPVIFPCYAQYKYDGVRCFSFVEDEEVDKVSRNGKSFEHLDHLDEAIRIFFGGRDWIVDGELYSHTLTFQEIISAVKREQALNSQIMYRIYDAIPMDDLKATQESRIEHIRELRKQLQIYNGREDVSHITTIEFCPSWVCEDMDDVKERFAIAISKGYEGIILRNMGASYHFGHRSRNLMKYKEFLEEEFEILGAEEATGRDEGTAVMVLRTNVKPYQEFRARPLGSRQHRRSLLININQYIGEMGTVKFQEYTDDGIPRFPIFKAIRNYE